MTNKVVKNDNIESTEFENDLLFGIGAEPIRVQLERDRLECENAEHYQKIADAISALQETDYIEDRQVEVLREKLFRSMHSSIRPQEKRLSGNELQRAVCIMLEAHAGQVDKGGVSYVNHPIYVALQMSTEDEKIVALLHDVVEDSDLFTIEYLRSEFGDTIVDAVDALTKRVNEPYVEYLERVKSNELARRVKVEDIKHNLDIFRIPEPSRYPESQKKKYRAALEHLTEGGAEHHEDRLANLELQIKHQNRIIGSLVSALCDHDIDEQVCKNIKECPANQFDDFNVECRMEACYDCIVEYFCSRKS